ncbi:MAG: cyanophycinase [Gemmataceae bacterium]|nr:cyanophycinase [Gemmataceae bacterium]
MKLGRIIVLLALFASPLLARAQQDPPRVIGPLVIIGGAEETDGGEILRRFVKLSGGDHARIAVITAALGDPGTTGEKYRKAFKAIGAREANELQTGTREEIDSEANLKIMTHATGVFFTGGDQVRLVDLLRKTNVEKLMHQRRLDGLAIGGTSAGASMMSEFMAATDKGPIMPLAKHDAFRRGLGFLPGTLIDPHFSQRARIGRLLSAVADRPQCLGIGIDADTAIVVTGNEKAEVLGSGAVMIVDASTATHNNKVGRQPGDPIALFGLTVHVLPRGSTFDLKSRRPGDGNTAKNAEPRAD